MVETMISCTQLIARYVTHSSRRLNARSTNEDHLQASQTKVHSKQPQHHDKVVNKKARLESQPKVFAAMQMTASSLHLWIPQEAHAVYSQCTCMCVSNPHTDNASESINKPARDKSNDERMVWSTKPLHRLQRTDTHRHTLALADLLNDINLTPRTETATEIQNVKSTQH